MRFPLIGFSVMVFFAVSISAADAVVQHNLGNWFYAATALNESPDATAVKSPDFLPGRSQHSMRCGLSGVPIGNGIWQLVKYDRTHGIGLAMAGTDQCSVALFKAPSPGVRVADGDLSAMSTGRGVRIGTPYHNVIAAYGGKPAKRAGRIVVAYTSNVPGTSMANPRKPVSDPEVITFVIENGRVSSMTISIDESGEF